MNTLLRRTRVLATVVAASVALPSFAWATPEKAAEYYQQASAAYQRGELREASDLLERAYAEDPDLVYQYNRVLALEGLKDYDEALRVLSIYGDPMRRDDRQRFNDIQEIRKRLEDGAALEKKLAEERKQKEQEQNRHTAEPVRKIEEPAVKGPVEQETPWLAVGLVSAGAVALGAGALFGSGLLVADQRDNTQCVEDNLDAGEKGSAVFDGCNYEEPTLSSKRDAYNDDVDAIETQQTLALVFLGAGAVLAATGVVVWLLDDSEDSGQTAQISPYVGGDGAGAVLNVSF